MPQPRTAKEVLKEVEKNEDKRKELNDADKFEIQDLELVYKSYEIMKKYIEKLHPGTSIL